MAFPFFFLLFFAWKYKSFGFDSFWEVRMRTWKQICFSKIASLNYFWSLQYLGTKTNIHETFLEHDKLAKEFVSYAHRKLCNSYDLLVSSMPTGSWALRHNALSSFWEHFRVGSHLRYESPNCTTSSLHQESNKKKKKNTFLKGKDFIESCDSLSSSIQHPVSSSSSRSCNFRFLCKTPTMLGKAPAFSKMLIAGRPTLFSVCMLLLQSSLRRNIAESPKIHTLWFFFFFSQTCGPESRCAKRSYGSLGILRDAADFLNVTKTHKCLRRKKNWSVQLREDAPYHWNHSTTYAIAHIPTPPT